MKKIITTLVFLCMAFLSFSSVFAESDFVVDLAGQKAILDSFDALSREQRTAIISEMNSEFWLNWATLEENLVDGKIWPITRALDSKVKSAQAENACASWNCIDKSNFKIKVADITPWGNLWLSGSGQEQATGLLNKIINILFGLIVSVSLFIMVIGAGYMIFYTGQDELLSKWKSIFVSGIIATVVASVSYYLIDLIRYILFN